MKKRKENIVEVCNLSNNRLSIRIMQAIVTLLFAFQIFFVFFWNNDSNRTLIGNITFASFSFLALISCIRIYLKMQANFPMEKRGYLYLAISFALFFLGDLIWLVNEIILKKIMPLGGIPDLLWSLAYFALITAIIYFISFSFRESNFWLYLILIVGIIAGGALLYSDIAEDLSEGAFDFAHAIQDSYIFYDLVLLILIIYLIWPMFRIKSRLMISWILLFVGVFIRLIYDYIFAEISENGTYFTGHWIDIIYIAFYVLIIFSNISKCKTLEVKNA